jgi:hypothetical protein
MNLVWIHSHNHLIVGSCLLLLHSLYDAIVLLCFACIILYDSNVICSARFAYLLRVAVDPSLSSWT